MEVKADEAGRRAHELAEKALTLQARSTEEAIGSVKEVAGGSIELAKEITERAIENSSKQSNDEIKIKKDFILECLKYLDAPNHEFNTEIYKAIIPLSGDENRQEKSLESFSLRVTIRIGLEYYDELISDGEDVADLLNKIINTFFSFTGGVLDRKMGGWRDTKEPALELSASMQYLELYSNLNYIKYICQIACLNLNQTTVYVELSGPEPKYQEVNPLTKEQKQRLGKQKDGKEPVTFNQGIFEMLDEKMKDVDSGFSHA